MNVLEISALDAREILVPVSAQASGAAVDPTADVVEMAFVVDGSDPQAADWITAAWETDTSRGTATYYAKCLAESLTAGTLYGVWIRIYDDPETVVARVGYVRPY